MLAPGGNFAIAQFRQVFDSPDLNLLLAETWDHHFPVDSAKPHPLPDLLGKLENSLLRLYAIVHWQDFGYNKVYPDEKRQRRREALAEEAGPSHQGARPGQMEQNGALLEACRRRQGKRSRPAATHLPCGVLAVQHRGDGGADSGE